MFPRKVGSAWEIFTPAKLNLYLEVLGPPVAGFHPLETLMVPVRIFDQLRWTENFSSGPKLQIRELLAKGDLLSGLVPTDGKNLVLQATSALARAAGVEPRGVFELVKRIPVQAGLGGGSSDAAAALRLANACWNIHYSPKRLSQLAAGLGSDIPFFLKSEAAICRGRGEQVEPVAGLPRMHFVLVKPPVGLATPEVFGRLERGELMNTEQAAVSSARLTLLIEALRRGALAEAGRWMVNRLEPAARQLTPWIARLRSVLAPYGCLGLLMTGSGTTYVAVMWSARQARRIARVLAGMNLGNVFATSSC